MIQVLDKISYLPKSSSGSLSFENEIYNEFYKKTVQEVKKAVQNLNSFGKSATVTLVGSVKKSGSNISITITRCEDADLHQRLDKVLKQANFFQ